jgi:ferredoxin-NADP reductase
MAGTAALRRLKWQTARVLDLHDETPTARTLTFAVRDWTGHLPGQHIDLRLTAPDGYTAVRSYSVASAPNSDGRIDITVERLPNGEVSPYLTQELMVGDELELQGPIGGWFVWRSEQPEPIQLIAGGSGIAPLMGMIRSRALAKSTAPFRLLYSVREPGAIFYRTELEALSTTRPFVMADYAFTRVVPKYWPRPSGRIDGALIASATWPASAGATCYVCGPTGFVESVAELLSGAGNRRDKIKTERFGATGRSK